MSVDALTNEKLLWLEPWMEIKGILTALSEDNQSVYLRIGSRNLSFRKGTNEAHAIQKHLSEKEVEQEISILRTDLISNPILIKIF